MLMDSWNKMKKALHSWSGRFGRFGRFGTGWWFGTFLIFPYIGNNHSNWLSYLSEGLKPARLDLVYPIIDPHCMPALPWEIGHHFEKGLRLNGFCPKGAVYGDGWQQRWHPVAGPKWGRSRNLVLENLRITWAEADRIISKEFSWKVAELKEGLTKAGDPGARTWKMWDKGTWVNMKFLENISNHIYIYMYTIFQIYIYIYTFI